MNDSKPERAPFRMTPIVFHVLLSLVDGNAHAYRIMKDVDVRSEGAVRIGPGSLHFTLSKLDTAGMIVESTTRPDASKDDVRRKYYELTAYGRQILRTEVDALERIVRLARSKDLASEGQVG